MASSTSNDAPAESALSFDDVQFQDCPRCTVGVLYVTVWDPDATHEAGENEGLADAPSGGAYHFRCFNCGNRGSVAFNAPLESGEEG